MGLNVHNSHPWKKVFTKLRINGYILRMIRSQFPPQTGELRIAAFISIDTEHGRSILRGIARYYRSRSNVTVLKFGQTSHYDSLLIRRMRLSGVIAKVGSRKDEDTLVELGVPVINVSGQLEKTKVPTIDSDDSHVGEMALHHLYSRGHRHFAYCGNPRHHASQVRLEAFKRAARQVEGVPPVAMVAMPQGDQNSPYSGRVQENLLQWIKSLPKPVGIFTFTDRIAVEIEEVCARSEIRVPEEVAILGVGNDLTRLEFAHVELSSVQLNTERIGLLAAESLDQLLKGTGIIPRRLLVPPLKIVTRRSTDRYAVADNAVGEALDYIRQHIGNTIYVTEIARSVGLSRRSFEQRFRKALGESVYEAVQRIKLEHAKELLLNPAIPIGEVAFTTGFPDGKSFARAFAGSTGETPTAYRSRKVI